MKNWKYYCLIAACGLFSGCVKTSRSISHSGYPDQPSYCGLASGSIPLDSAFEYRGELSEFDVLGIARGEATSEPEIQRALDNAKSVRLAPGNSVLLIQSGALFPDGPMVTELSKHFRVVPFSGVPASRGNGTRAQMNNVDARGFSQALRLAAAHGGADVILCYWGVLESENDQLPTKTISWVPVANWFVPDEKQHMRIRVTVALVDVRTGNWSTFCSKPFDDTRISTSPRRGAVDQKQVERLKNIAYAASVEQLVSTFN